jgi:hypothetical protein
LRIRKGYVFTTNMKDIYVIYLEYTNNDANYI